MNPVIPLIAIMDPITSLLVVENIVQSFNVVQAALQALNQQAPIQVAASELEGLSEVLLQSKSLWKLWGSQLCLYKSKHSVPDQEILDIQRLMDQARALCEAIRFHTPLQQHFSQGLIVANLNGLVFQEGEARGAQSVIFEQLKVLDDLKSVLESMLLPEAKLPSLQMVVRRSFETEETLLDATIPASRSSSLFSLWRHKWVPAFKRQKDILCCLKTSKSISPAPGPPQESPPEGVCNCLECISDAKARSKAIDLELRRDAELAKNDKNILLLGFKESIDQVSQQLLRVDKDPYTAEELAEKKISIRKQTAHDVANQLYSWSRKGRGTWNLNSKGSGSVNEELVERFLVEVEACEILSSEQASEFESLWLGYWKHRGRKPHPSTYFLNNISRIASQSYTPTETDISHLPLGYSRFRPLPTLLHQSHSTLRLNIIHHLIQSGCCGGGKQLLNVFSNTSAVIFPLDLTCYSQIQDYHEQTNHSSNIVNEGTSLFSSIVDAAWFKDLPIFLWLGNVEKFKTIVEEEPDGMEKFLPGYDVANDGDKAIDFIVEKYLNCANGRKNIFVSFLRVMDPTSVKKAVHEMGDNLLTSCTKERRILS